jgi:lipoprotein-anchoring transpeptidase ErfK/SrfK/DNA-binding SARP family transcriptional activator
MTGIEPEQDKNAQDVVQQLLKAATAAAREGRRDEAYRRLREAVAADPSDEAAWLWLAGVSDQPDEVQAALNRVEQLNPDHPRLAVARSWARARLTTAVSRPPQNPASPNVDVETAQPDLAVSPASTRPASPASGPKSRGTVPSASPGPYQGLLLAFLGMAVVMALAVLVLVIWAQVSMAQTSSRASDNTQSILALQPELSTAIAEARWEDAIALLQTMRGLDPENATFRQQLASVYYQLALERRDRREMDGAIVALDESLSLAPDDAVVQRERRVAGAYLQGVRQHQAGNWVSAVEALTAVRREIPTYLDTVELLYDSNYNLGLSLQAADDLPGAQRAYEAAAELKPNEPLPRQKADAVAWLLRPPTPTPAPTPTPTPDPNPQRIVVDISEQQMYVYEGDKLLWQWVVSTGEPGRDTAVGQFKIQSKIEKAYASTWNLDMPYWLGIYWSGPIEDGIHALPINRSTGLKLWEGLLGKRVSYGCIILSDENARTLYEWAKMGTPVIVQP